ncbi:MAG: adenylate/guanylate cyclase domain-containing protein [Deltaproteobacteria bacterium]|nr:adenylate/guanylate cyclase domain-containing protein [Deltaproteobacteria bacterium]
MPATPDLEDRIRIIEETFSSADLTGSKEEILAALNRFEDKTRTFTDMPESDAVIRWYKNLFLQKVHFFPRAEQLLDEALHVLEDASDPLLQRWKLRILISLGYVHRARCNYMDADAYLHEALAMALADPALSGFMGEIYSLLGSVNLLLNRNDLAQQYVLKEKAISRNRYQEQPEERSRALAYGFSLINWARIHRKIGLIATVNRTDIETAVALFSRFRHDIGQAVARLELAEYLCETNAVDEALRIAESLEPIFASNGMPSESILAGLITMNAFHKIFQFERARSKGDALLALADAHGMGSDRIMADVYYAIGICRYEMNEEDAAMTCFRKSARLGMVHGTKSAIVRAFNAARKIDRHQAEALLTSDLVYQDAEFVRNRVERSINPFKETRTKLKIPASTLFLDIVGFSTIMMRSDEDLTVKMMDELIDRICLIVYLYGGYVDKFLGDGVMAIFEHGEALRPSVALNTVKCGLDILRALKHKNYKLKKHFEAKQNIDVRIGVSTGEIYAMLLGNYIKTEFTYLGNAVNLASKLEKQAASRMVLIDEKTRELAEDGILSEPLVVTIPGIGDTTAHRVVRLKRKNERS